MKPTGVSHCVVVVTLLLLPTSNAWSQDGDSVFPHWASERVDGMRLTAAHEISDPSQVLNHGDPDHDRLGRHDPDSHNRHHHDFDDWHWELSHHGRHHSVDGYPFMHLLRTDHAFLENKFQLDYALANNADNGEVDEAELEMEVFWSLSNRLAILFEVPVLMLDPTDAPNTEGVGDFEVGLQMIAFNGERTIVAFGLNVAVPTGDEDRGLGVGHASFAPKAYLFHDLGGGTSVQGEYFFEIPVDAPEVENEFVYNMGVIHVLASTCDWTAFRYLSPLVEINGVTAVNGDHSGHTFVNLTTGFRWMVGESNQMGFGYSFPVSGAESFDSALLLSFIMHL